MHRQILDEIMVANLKDTESSWLLAADGSYSRVPDGQRAFSAHDYFMNNPSLSGRGSALERDQGPVLRLHSEGGGGAEGGVAFRHPIPLSPIRDPRGGGWHTEPGRRGIRFLTRGRLQMPVLATSCELGPEAFARLCSAPRQATRMHIRVSRSATDGIAAYVLPAGSGHVARIQIRVSHSAIDNFAARPSMRSNIPDSTARQRH